MRKQKIKSESTPRPYCTTGSTRMKDGSPRDETARYLCYLCNGVIEKLLCPCGLRWNHHVAGSSSFAPTVQPMSCPKQAWYASEDEVSKHRKHKSDLQHTG